MNSRSREGSINSSQLNVDGEFESLQSLAHVDADTRFNSQLQRISRTIYDQLGSTHFGKMMGVRSCQSLLSDELKSARLEGKTI